MLWVQAEYALKGIFLGLLLYVGLQAPTWDVVGRIAIYMLLGLSAALVIGMLKQLADLPRLLAKPHAFIVFLLLENPLLVYSGVLGGLVYGAYTEAHISGFVSLFNLTYADAGKPPIAGPGNFRRDRWLRFRQPAHGG
jgi:hypothetical protein